MGAGRCSLMHIGAVNVEKTSSGIETSAAPLSIWAWLGKCSALDCHGGERLGRCMRAGAWARLKEESTNIAIERFVSGSDRNIRSATAL
jgi:hypothetical protein